MEHRDVDRHLAKISCKKRKKYLGPDADSEVPRTTKKHYEEKDHVPTTDERHASASSTSQPSIDSASSVDSVRNHSPTDSDDIHASLIPVLETADEYLQADFPSQDFDSENVMCYSSLPNNEDKADSDISMGATENSTQMASSAQFCNLPGTANVRSPPLLLGNAHQASPVDHHPEDSGSEDSASHSAHSDSDVEEQLHFGADFNAHRQAPIPPDGSSPSSSSSSSGTSRTSPRSIQPSESSSEHDGIDIMEAVEDDAAEQHDHLGGVEDDAAAEHGHGGGGGQDVAAEQHDQHGGAVEGHDVQDVDAGEDAQGNEAAGNPENGQAGNVPRQEGEEVPAGVGVNPQHHQRLRNKMGGPYMGDVDMPVTASRNDMLYMALGMARHSKQSNTEFNNTINLLNNLFPAEVLPSTRYLIDRLLVDNMGATYHFFCSECFFYFGELDYIHVKTYDCPNAECNKVNVISDLRVAHFFAMFDVRIQLEVLLNKPEIFESIVTPAEAQQNYEEGRITGITSGAKYRLFVNNLGDHNDHVFSSVMSVDGSPVADSSLHSIWPIQSEVLELPTHLRQANLLLCGLWFGSKYVKMDLFLIPFVNHMRVLSAGFQITVRNHVWDCRFFTIGCNCDSGARGSVQGIKTHSGYNSCNWCLITGEWISGAVRFPSREGPPTRRRTHEEMVRLQRAIGDNPQAVESDDDEEEEGNIDPVNAGVKVMSPLINLPKFDMVDGFFVESMHLIDLGIMKAFLGKWLEDYGFPYYIKDFVPEINRKIQTITPNVEFRRMPRTLEEWKRWNARELHNFGAFMAVPVLHNILHPRFLKVCLLFIQANYLLDGLEVTHEDIDIARALGLKFHSETQRLYDDTDMSFNMHIYLHLPDHVANWGQLFDTSAYASENGNGYLKSIIHSTQGVPQQIVRFLSWDLAFNMLDQVVSQRAKDFVKSISEPKKNKEQSIKIADVRVIGKPIVLNLSEEEIFLCEREDHDVANLDCIKKIIYNGCVFTSDKQEYVTSNSVALLVDKSVVIIRQILYDRTLHQVFCLVSDIQWDPILVLPQGIRMDRNKHFMRKITHINEEERYIGYDSLKIVCFRANLGNDGDFLAPFPNVRNRY